MLTLFSQLRPSTVVHSLLAFLSILSLSLAIPQSVPALYNGNGTYHISGQTVASSLSNQELYERALKKHGLVIPTMPFKRGVSSRSSSSITGALNSNHTEYLVTLNIGGQDHQAVFDTGSYSTWIKGFNATTRYFRDGETISDHYGDGSLANSIIWQGPISLGPMGVMSQAFGSFNVGQIDSPGTLGMSFDSTYSTDLYGTHFTQFCFFTNLQATLAEPTFTVNLEPESRGASADFWFGLVPSSIGSPTYTSLYTEDDGIGWPLQIASYSIGSNGTRYTNPPSCKYWDADTGTTLAMLEHSIVENYWHSVPGSSGDSVNYIYPCGTKLPDLVLKTVDGLSVSLLGENLGRAGDDGKCYGLLQGVPEGCILGQPLFHSNYVVFDHGNEKVGFATKSL